jgi:uncharacterized protein (DUF302 family)
MQMATILDHAQKMLRGETSPPPKAMTFQWRWVLMLGTALVGGIVLGNIIAHDRSEAQRPGGHPMQNSRVQVDHVHRTTDRSFEEVTHAFEGQLGRFDPDVYQSLTSGGDAEETRAKLAALAGPSGFMLFATHNHGALLSLAGQKRKAVQYIVGNPLFALQMTQHDIRASLYAPLRVLLYENEEGKTCVEYDRPSSLFGQFENDRIRPTATMLDQKMEALVTAALN